ncbi:MAG: phosphoenolpyruvate carboxylase [Flavobacteriales bacterium]
MNVTDAFHRQVALRYQLYNSLFLLLPFEGIFKTGTLLPLFSKCCEDGFRDGKTAAEIVERFATDYLSENDQSDIHRLLFQFIQYLERQVVLFDSVEDASYDQIKDLNGRGSLNALRTKLIGESHREAFRSLINNSSVGVVLTAHPTQFYTGEVLAIITDLDESIRKGEIADVELLLRQLGKTPFIKKLKPSPYDEAISLIWYLENIFYTALPKLLRQILGCAGMLPDEWVNEHLFHIGFWPGGDRDGNPFVNADITSKVAAKLKNTVLRCYYRDLRKVRRRLSFKGILPMVLNVENKIFGMAYGNEHNAYRNASDFLNDLIEIHAALIEHHDGLFAELLEEIIIKVRLFGFFFARMDLRQQNKKHHLAIDQMLQHQGASEIYAELNDSQKVNLLLHMKEFAFASENADAHDFYSAVEQIKHIQQKNGSQACSRYIISNAGSASDVIEVFVLARHIFETDTPPIDVIPLFESIEDLAMAPDVMAALYSIPEYRTHLQKRDSKQVIMLGFSDGTKDGGYMKANWSIFKAKEALTRRSEQFGIEAIFFDGRGGPPGRGGGNTYEYYAAQGKNISSKHIQLTVQGQTISSNFGKIVSCQHNLEQLFCAMVDNQLFHNTDQELKPEDYKLLDEMSEVAYQTYLKLKNHPSFVTYLENATPLKWFGETNIGSRPAKRNAAEGLVFEDLRAIPFVGSWAQMKQNIPGYYGLGAAFEYVRNSGKQDELIRLCSKSPYFRTMLSNSMQSLTKCNFSISSWLAQHESFADMYEMMKAEYQYAVTHILWVMQQEELMQDFPVSKASVLLREKIILPLVTIQQYALQRLNQSELADTDRKTLEKLILRCMFGIINASRNAA